MLYIKNECKIWRQEKIYFTKTLRTWNAELSNNVWCDHETKECKIQKSNIQQWTLMVGGYATSYLQYRSENEKKNIWSGHEPKPSITKENT